MLYGRLYTTNYGLAEMDIEGLFAAAESHAMTLGRFDRIGRHEPKNAPGSGLTVAIIGTRITGSEGASGLAATTARVEFTVRIYSNMTQEPQDAIDPDLLGATDLLLNAYSGDFQLGGAVMAIDLLGAYGEPLAAQSGYVTVDQTMYRVMDITLPMVIADAWTQAA